MERHSFICGLPSLTLQDKEGLFLSRTAPCGIILFARNIDTPDQVRSLIASAKQAIPEEPLLIMADQEGGRVQRLGPPHWRRYPPAAAFAARYRDEPDATVRAAFLCAHLMGEDLHELGFNAVCAPVLDLPVEGADGVIGDRAYGTGVEIVTALGRAVADGFLAAGILPVMKHIPGHGRANADSHFELPTVGTSADELDLTDFRTFRNLRDLPMAMTAHVVFSDLDAGYPATTSATIVRDTIRQSIGFEGLLLSDDLSMKALTGTLAERTKAALEAGCDLVLHCNGSLAEMEEVAAASGPLRSGAAIRFEGAFEHLSPPQPFDRAEAGEALRWVLAETS